MKLPLIATAAGLVVGIAIAFVLQPDLDSVPGIAVLLIVCVLIANLIAWGLK